MGLSGGFHVLFHVRLCILRLFILRFLVSLSTELPVVEAAVVDWTDLARSIYFPFRDSMILWIDGRESCFDDVLDICK